MIRCSKLPEAVEKSQRIVSLDLTTNE